MLHGARKGEGKDRRGLRDEGRERERESYDPSVRETHPPISLLYQCYPQKTAAPDIYHLLQGVTGDGIGSGGADTGKAHFLPNGRWLAW